MALLPQFWAAVTLGIAGIAILRISWARPSRSTRLNTLGWASNFIAAVLAIGSYGAWGLAVVSLFAMAAALLLLIPSIASQPSWKRKIVSRGAHAGAGENRELALGRRLATLVIAGPAALLAALLLALALRALLAGAGGAQADANVLVLACVPVFWSILATALLMAERRNVQFTLLAAVVLLAAPITIFAG